MSIFSNHISILVMPTDICNMDCVYCFHNSHHKKQGKMSLETLKRLYDITFSCYKDVTLIWHGGEPLVMGLDFYRKAFEMQKNYVGVKVTNRMQSNLTLLSDEMADFFSKNNVGIGTSMDGSMNEVLRGNTSTILDNRKKLLERNKSCGFIMVLSNKNIDSLISSYELFKSLNSNYNINPYVATPTFENLDLILDAHRTIEKLIEFYEYWKEDTYCNIHVSFFERIIEYIMYKKKSVCKYNSCMGKWLGIRYNGDVVPCNRYFPEEYTYGNVWNIQELHQAFDSVGFQKLLTQSIERRKKCKNCNIFDFCSGGCNNVALNENGVQNNMGNTCIISIAVYEYIFLDMKKNRMIDKVKNPMIRALIK